MKICGTGTFADLQAALDAEADAIGFLMGITHLTQDAVSCKDAAAMVATLPPFVEPVAVTHLQVPADLIRILKESCCTTLQIQNTVSTKDIEEIRDELSYVKIVKAVHVMDASAVRAAMEFESVADAIILDTRTKERLGGTGIPHDWHISAKIVDKVNLPIILAGGLTPENVLSAIEQVHPYAVDVHTGVKRGDARDPGLTKAFVSRAKNADRFGHAL